MKIKKWLLPGRHNNYHPHLLRPLGLSLVVAALLGINILQNVTAAHTFQVLGYATDINATDVISISNQYRIDNGIASLKYNSKLAQAAQAKAHDMFADDYWAHYAPDGTSPWSFITGAGYAYTTAGENLAKDFSTSSGVVNGWMNSSGHRANILNESFVDTGVAVVNGNLQGSDTTLVVAFYAAPKPSSSPTPAPTKPKSTTRSTTQTTAPAKTTSTPVEPEAKKEPNPTPKPTVTDTKPVTDSKAKPAVDGSKPVTEPASVAQAKVIETRAVSMKEKRTWSQNATLFILTVLLLVSILKHTTVWRSKRTSWRHIWLRAHPAAQYALLIVAIVATLSSSVGVIR
jgi:uncharacterized protein YkwD